MIYAGVFYMLNVTSLYFSNMSSYIRHDIEIINFVVIRFKCNNSFFMCVLNNVYIFLFNQKILWKYCENYIINVPCQTRLSRSNNIWMPIIFSKLTTTFFKSQCIDFNVCLLFCWTRLKIGVIGCHFIRVFLFILLKLQQYNDI